MRFFFVPGVAVLCVGLIHAQTLTQVWTEVGDHGTLARVVVNSQSDCPSITVDGKAMPMQVRLPIPQGLKPACELAIPTTAKSATVAVQGKALALPHADPSRVVVIGDTGCRIKGGKVQDCNDPAKWPFRRVAVSAAESKPDLVIHVGDYLYREEPCPANAQADCGGTPSGDTWEAWDADFFEPAAQLLAAAPWAFSRGNHESCDRSWRGWFYYLDPRPFQGACEAYSAPYLIRLGSLELMMLDSASATDKTATKDYDQKGVEKYAAELAATHVTHAWLVLHHPLWGLKAPAAADASGLPSETPNDVTAAWEKSPNKGIDMIVSGHTHLFELLSFDHDRPTQLVAGDGGTDMGMALPAKVAGLKVGGATLLSGQNLREFGYTALTRTSPKEPWHLALTSSGNKVLEEATVPITTTAK